MKVKDTDGKTKKVPKKKEDRIREFFYRTKDLRAMLRLIESDDLYNLCEEKLTVLEHTAVYGLMK